MVAVSVALGPIGIRAGKSVPITDAATDETAPLVDFLKSDGFVSFRRSEESVADMAGHAIQDCFAKSDLRPDDIDAILYSTESFWDTDDGRGDPISVRNAMLNVLFGDCSLAHAHVHGCWTNECANLSSVLSLAKAMVASGGARNVLVVVSDRQDAHVPRVMANGASIMSDVAACTVVTPNTDGPILRHVVTHSAPDVFAAERCDDVQHKIQAMVTALGGFKARIETVTGRSPRDYPLVLTDNLHTMYLDFVRDGLGLDASQTLQPSKSDFAHGFSLDGLLGLDALMASDDLPRGVPIALLNVIPWSFGFTVLEMP